MVWIYRVLSYFFPQVTWAQAYNINVVLRKTGHFLGYAALSWFAFRGWMETLAYQRERWLKKLGRAETSHRRWHLRAAVLAVLVTFAAASLDEFHQSILPGRTGTVRDVVLDTMGGVFAQVVLLFYWTRRADEYSRDLTGSVRRNCKSVVADEQAG